MVDSLACYDGEVRSSIDDKHNSYQYYVPAKQVKFSQAALILVLLNFKTSGFANLKVCVCLYI